MDINADIFHKKILQQGRVEPPPPQMPLTDNISIFETEFREHICLILASPLWVLNCTMATSCFITYVRLSQEKFQQMYANYEMFVRMLTVHCDQNNSYEITINGFQVRNINEIRNAIFGCPLWETLLSVKAEVGMFTKLSTWWYPKIFETTLLK